MQDNREKINYLKQSFAQVVKSIRQAETNLSCNKAEDEYDIGKGHLNRIENGKVDPSLSTMWKISELNNKKLSLIIAELESILGDDFSLTD